MTERASNMTTTVAIKRLCRKITAMDLYKHGYLSQDELLRELREETALDNPEGPVDDGMRKLRCGLCNKTVATISLTIRPFGARCLECMP